MKKLLAIALLLCLVCAFVPASAVDSYTLDLSKGPVVHYINSSSTQERMLTDTLLAASRNGDVWSNPPYDQGFLFTGYPFTCYYLYDLDRDGKYDLSIEDYQASSESANRRTYSVADGTAITGSYKLTLSDTSPLFDVAEVFSEVTFIFPGGSEEPEIVSTYSDSTGVYTLNVNDEATYEGMLNQSRTSMKVPATISVGGKTYKVTKIADNAFRKNTKLKKASIGANIKEIGKNAFFGCTKLAAVSGGAGLEVIGDSAFNGCKALKSFTIGAKVKQIGKKAFYKCSALRKLTIKSKLLSKSTVGSSAFKGIFKTATVKVPKAVKKEYTKWLLKKGIKKTMKIK